MLWGIASHCSILGHLDDNLHHLDDNLFKYHMLTVPNILN